MGQTIYEEIAEIEEKLNLNPEGDDDADTDNDKPDAGKSDRKLRGQDGHDEGERPEQRDGQDSGTGSKRGARTRTSSRKGGTSSEDAGALDGHSGESRGTRGDSQRTRESASRESEGTREDVQASHEDGEADGSDGQGGQHRGQVEETTAEDDKPKTNADWARQRRELRELKAKLAQLESAKPAAPAAPIAETKPAVEIVKTAEKSTEPDKNVNYQAWLEWKQEQHDKAVEELKALKTDYDKWKTGQIKEKETQTAINNAVGEFQSIEESYQQKNPDYLNAMDYARKEYSRALKLTNPQMTAKQIDAKIDYDILAFASQKSSAGLNPAEELYDMAIERFGYSKAEARALAEDVEDRPRKPVEKSNLRTISNNKRRSASPLSGGGRGGDIPVTLEVAAQEMTLGEFANLDPQTLAHLESMGG